MGMGNHDHIEMREIEVHALDVPLQERGVVTGNPQGLNISAGQDLRCLRYIACSRHGHFLQLDAAFGENAAQFFQQARKDLGDLDGQFSRGEFGNLLNWLRQNIHRHGRRYSHHPADHAVGELLAICGVVQRFRHAP